jgi:hypothetical protein
VMAMVSEEWRRFALTVRVVLASALVREESIQAPQRLGNSRLAFRLMAASAGEQPALPADGWFDSGRRVRVTCAMQGGDIRVQLQAEGFSALRSAAGRLGRLVASNGAFDVAVRFDSGGRALAVLADSDAVRHGLHDFELRLDPG